MMARRIWLIVVVGTGGSADTDQFPKVFNSVLGAKMRIVAGYPGGNDINLAMERGEVSGRCGWSWSSVISTQPGWLKEKKINVLVQLSLEKHPDLPDVPIITDFASGSVLMEKNADELMVPSSMRKLRPTIWAASLILVKPGSIGFPS